MPDRKKPDASKRLDREATRLLAKDVRATREVMRSVVRAWERREERLRDENDGELPPVSIAASDLFETFARWTSATTRPARETMGQMPALLAEFVAASAVFAKSYGQNVYLPVLQTNGEFVPPPKHDVERPALRLVKTAKRRKAAEGEKR